MDRIEQIQMTGLMRHGLNSPDKDVSRSLAASPTEAGIRSFA